MLFLNVPPTGSPVASVLSLVIPLSCFFSILGWWTWIILRRPGKL